MADSSDSPAAAKAIQVKLVLLGEAAVGKSSLVLRFVSNDFNENNSPTIGAAFLTQKCRLEDKVIKFEIWDTAGQERFHSLAPMYYRNAAAAVVVYDVTKASSLEKAKSWVNELQRQANPNIVIALVGNKLDLVDDAAQGASASVDTPTETAADEADKDAQEVEEEEEDEDAEENGVDEEEAAKTAKSTSKTAAAAPASSASSSASVRQVSRETAEAYAKEAGGLLFFEASAKTGQNVQELFTEIAKNLPQESIQPKGGAGNGGAAGGANARRAAGAQGTTGQGGAQGGSVNLNEGRDGKKVAGGCC